MGLMGLALTCSVSPAGLLEPDTPKMVIDDAATADETDHTLLSAQIGLDWVSQYLFRGYLEEDDGAIVQPWGEVSLDVLERGDWSVSVFGGAWASLHGRTDSAESRSDLPNFYELDLYGGVGLYRQNAGIEAEYIAYLSPSGAFDDSAEVVFTLLYDDSEEPLLDGVSLNPRATLAFEVGGPAYDAVDRGVYLELGLTPTLVLEGEREIEIGFPLRLGLSASEYYQDEDGNDRGFGFSSVGCVAGIPIRATESLRLVVGEEVFFLGTNTAAFNEGGDIEVVLRVGLAYGF